MFERFTEKAIKVIMLAQEEARRLGHNFVGTEQMVKAQGLRPKSSSRWV
jgi:ATP-dependent Clp protease ATP-binding subunit ClpC